MTEAEYLANYDPKAFKAQLLTVDAVLFTYHDQQLKVLLEQRSNHPFLGFWGLFFKDDFINICYKLNTKIILF